jgi:hypothetical protein
MHPMRSLRPNLLTLILVRMSVLELGRTTRVIGVRDMMSNRVEFPIRSYGRYLFWLVELDIRACKHPLGLINNQQCLSAHRIHCQQ